MPNIKQKTFYSKSILMAVRIIALITLILLSITTTVKFHNLLVNNFYSSYPIKTQIIGFTNIFLNITIIAFSCFLLIWPQKFLLIGIGSFLYSITMSLVNSDYYMSLIMLCVSFSTGVIRIRNKKEQNIFFFLFVLFYFFELFSPLSKGLNFFLDYFFAKIGISIALFISVFFFYEYGKQLGIRYGTKDKILNIAQFKELDRSDMFLLQDVLNNMKYKEIAQKLHGSEGAQRNKLSKIYKILEVGDRTGFLTIYSGYKLIYEPEQFDTLTS